MAAAFPVGSATALLPSLIRAMRPEWRNSPSNPPQQHQNDNDDQDDTDAAVSVAVTIETAANLPNKKTTRMITRMSPGDTTLSPLTLCRRQNEHASRHPFAQKQEEPKSPAARCIDGHGRRY